MELYFAKEGERIKESVKHIATKDLLTESEQCKTGDDMKNKPFFDLHVLLKYQEVMLTDAYVSPSARRMIDHIA